ncbi:MAG: alpha/beta fold hydrolase [Deltaproteobacteria bacterium]|nr:alpha/beta fold hydrolase [Deltaproteobacteria bacterium]
MKHPAWIPPRLYPFKSNFMEIDGCKVHYLDEGRGPVMLLLHGNPTWSFLYRDVIQGLRGSWRCIAPDYPGFGLSAAREGYDFLPESHAKIITELIAALGLQEITLMVQDWGGPIGMAAAGADPGRFKGFVIGNTWAWGVNGNKRFERFSHIMGGRIMGILIARFNAFVNLVMPRGVARKKLTREVMNAYRGPFPTPASRKPTHVFPWAILGSGKFLTGVEQGLAGLSGHPALLVWGNKDMAFKKEELQRWQSVFPQAETHILKGAGHFIQEDAPQEIVAHIQHWAQNLGRN